MPSIHTTIPDNALPTTLTDPNKIVTEYESYSLIPRLGPLAYAYAKKDAWRRLWHLHHTLKLLEKIERHKKTWRNLPNLSSVRLDAVSNIGLSPDDGTMTPVSVSGLAGNTNPRPVPAMALVNHFRALPSESVGLLSGARRVETARVALSDRVESTSSNEILRLLKEQNPVIDRLIQDGKLLDSKGALSNDLISLQPNERLGVVLDSMASVTPEPTDFLRSISSDILADALPKAGKKFGELGRVLGSNEPLRNRVIDSIADSFRDKSGFAALASLDDTAIVDSREWAFLRKEEVELMLEAPRFRGPLSINSVSPNSELTVSDSQTSSAQSISMSASGSRSLRGGNTLIANQIKEKLGTLYDYGSNLGQTMSEQGFERDHSRGEKRSIVEQTLNEISESNASKSIAISSSSNTSLREYKTQGKDTKFATTEVSFEAFSPVEVTHFLKEIGAVWCPRMRNPFYYLKQSIDDHADKVRSDYIAENYIVDPTEPLPTYEGIERVAVSTRRVTGDQVDDDDDGTIYEDTVTIRLSADQRNQHYFLSRDARCEFHQDDSAWSNGFDSDQYEVLEPEIVEFVENSHVTILTRLKVLDEPNGPNPDTIWLTVSVTRYKYTANYLEQLKEYRESIDTVNPARRQAVKAQARRYARLKKEELIARYSNDPKELRDFTFVSLMREMFGTTNGDWSYFLGVIKTCIDWDRATMELEPAHPDSLVANGLSPYHFLNVNAVRFFLPLHKGAEDAFFEAVSNTLDASWKALFKKVKDYIDRQRTIVEQMRERMNDDDRAKLTLDNYRSELVLGRHLEAVLSRTDFLET